MSACTRAKTAALGTLDVVPDIYLCFSFPKGAHRRHGEPPGAPGGRAFASSSLHEHSPAPIRDSAPDGQQSTWGMSIFSDAISRAAEGLEILAFACGAFAESRVHLAE